VIGPVIVINVRGYCESAVARKVDGPMVPEIWAHDTAMKRMRETIRRTGLGNIVVGSD
jgi:hypothetical protein